VGKEKVIIYNQIDGTNSNKIPYKYRCAVVTSGGNLTNSEQFKFLKEDDDI
jgi:hypothetical protein